MYPVVRWFFEGLVPAIGAALEELVYQFKISVLLLVSTAIMAGFASRNFLVGILAFLILIYFWGMMVFFAEGKNSFIKLMGWIASIFLLSVIISLEMFFAGFILQLTSPILGVLTLMTLVIPTLALTMGKEAREDFVNVLRDVFS